jgi:hypothetical protein
VIGVGPGKALENQVRRIQAQAAAGNRRAAQLGLLAFIIEVRVFSLWMIPPPLAASLIAQAANIIAVLG